MSKCLECGAAVAAEDGFCVVCEFVPGDDDDQFLEGNAPPATAQETASLLVPIAGAPGKAPADQLDAMAPGNDVSVLPPTAAADERCEVDIAVTSTFDHWTAPADASPTVHALLELDPSGPALRASDGEVLSHVILALDVSASMNHPDKYPVLTNALERMLTELRYAPGGEVLISIVLFAYGSEVMIRDARASELDPREVVRMIDASQLRFTRYTDFAGAMSRAGRIAFDAHSTDRRLPIRIYALTDGRPQDIARASTVMQRVERLPVDVHGLAFGADADVVALKSLIAGKRGGTVKHVRPDNLESAFSRIAAVATDVVAKRCLVDVQLAPGVAGGSVYRFRPGRYAYGDDAYGLDRDFRTDLGILEAGRKYSLLLEFVLPPTVQKQFSVGTVTMRIPGEGGPRSFEHLMVVLRHPGSSLATADPMVTEAVDIVTADRTGDPAATLRALRARKRLYEEERRDPALVELVTRAIAELEEQGSLDAMSKADRAALVAHTHSAR